MRAFHFYLCPCAKFYESFEDARACCGESVKSRWVCIRCGLAHGSLTAASRCTHKPLEAHSQTRYRRRDRRDGWDDDDD